MNYTENYKLPQWEEGDRVMRVDFNRMCGVLEDALTASGQAQKYLERLGRDAYRQTVQDWVRHGPGGSLDAMWINTLTSREEAGGDGHGWNGKYGVCHGNSGLPDLEAVKSSAIEECYISTVPTYVYQSKRAAVTFVSDGYGKIDQLGIFAWPNEHYTSTPFSFRVTMTRADDGSVVAEAGPFTTVLKLHTYLVSYYPVDFPLEPHTEYRMEFTSPEVWSFRKDQDQM